MFLSTHTEEIDLKDIWWGILALRNKGVPTDKIFVFTDHPVQHAHFTQFSGLNLESFDAIESTYPNLPASEHVVVIVLGHGGHMGVKSFSGKTFAPHPFVTLLKSAPEVRTVSIILGQCYAGLFNYLNVRGSPKVCILGATNLHLSMAAPMEATCSGAGINCEGNVTAEWVANIFMLRFFGWIYELNDVDGDGAVSILDGYRFAATGSNDLTRDIKKSIAEHLAQLQKVLEELKSAGEANDPGGDRRRAIELSIDGISTTLNLHQEPWVLHSDLARSIIIKL